MAAVRGEYPTALDRGLSAFDAKGRRHIPTRESHGVRRAVASSQFQWPVKARAQSKCPNAHAPRNTRVGYQSRSRMSGQVPPDHGRGSAAARLASSRQSASALTGYWNWQLATALNTCPPARSAPSTRPARWLGERRHDRQENGRPAPGVGDDRSPRQPRPCRWACPDCHRWGQRSR